MKKKFLAYMTLLTLFAGVIFAPVNSYGEEVNETETQTTSDFVAGADEMAPAQTVGKEGMTPVHGTDIADGTYPIEVESSSSMFRIVKAELTVSGGNMRAVITLGGKGYLKLFMGTGEEAVAAEESEYADYVEDADGAYTYEIPVEALNQELECTGFSKRKEKWYDHQICFDADTLPEEALLVELVQENTGHAEETEESETQETEVLQAAENMQVEQAEIDLADGSYQINVELAGGSGRATVESPAVITVTGKKAVASIVWSSPNYDYMIVNGEKYLPVNTEGNSTFEIPVLLFDGEMSITADTVAMSTPHEIAYTLTFDTDSITSAASEEHPLQGTLLVVAVILLLGCSCILIKKRKTAK